MIVTLKLDLCAIVFAALCFASGFLWGANFGSSHVMTRPANIGMHERLSELGHQSKLVSTSTSTSTTIPSSTSMSTPQETTTSMALEKTTQPRATQRGKATLEQTLPELMNESEDELEGGSEGRSLPTKSYSMRCDAERADALAKLDLRNFESHCPDRTQWLRMLAHTIRSDLNCIVSVGCNKGEGLIQAMRLFSNNELYDFSALIEAQTKYNNGSVVPSICPHRPQLSAGGKVKRSRGFCIEPLGVNIALIDHTFTSLGFKESITITRAGVSSSPGTGYFPGLLSTNTSFIVDSHVLKEGTFPLESRIWGWARTTARMPWTKSS